MNISKLIAQAKAGGFKGFCSEFKSQYTQLSPKGKKIFWGVGTVIVALWIGVGTSMKDEPEPQSDYDKMKDDVKAAYQEAKKGVDGELEKSREMLEEGTRDIKNGIDGLKGLSF